uniref:Ig-like domain-containing protein n=2 Tax=Scleropages formosus TaxID=113540 RepID=A0A8C9TW75_SCLFO
MPRISSLYLCMYVCSLVTESLTMAPVRPGHNVTINCSLSTENIYWYVQQPGMAPLAVLRSFADVSHEAIYFNDFKGKFVLQTHGRLLIQNVTRQDCMVFYCAVTSNESLVFSNGIKLNIDDMCPERQLSTFSLFIASVVSNCILIITVIVLAKKLSPHRYKPVRKLEPVRDEALYSVVQIPGQGNETNTTKLITSTYAVLQHP